MSLLTDPSDCTTAFKHYADCVVSILWGGRLAAGDNDRTSKKTNFAVENIHWGAFVEHSRFAKWLAQAISFSLRILPPTCSLDLGKTTLHPASAPTSYDGLAKEKEASGLPYTGSASISGT